MNVLLKAPEIEFQLRDSGARTLITFAACLDEAAKAAASADVASLYVAAATTPLAAGVPFDTLLAGDQPGPQLAVRSPADPAVIIYTSGTTGVPKGAVLSHITLYLNADIPGRLFGFSDDDVVVVALPLFHIFGLSSIMNTCVLLGGTMSLVPRFEAATVLEVIQRDRATVFEGVPTMYLRAAPGPRPGQLRPVVAARGHLGRGTHPGRDHRLVRAAVRRHDPGRLRLVRDRIHHDVQRQRRRAQDLQRRQAHLGR